MSRLHRVQVTLRVGWPSIIQASLLLASCAVHEPMLSNERPVGAMPFTADSFSGKSPKAFLPVLLPAEYRRLQEAAREEVRKSPIRSKVVAGIHHARIDPAVFIALLNAGGSPHVVPVLTFAVTPSKSVSVRTNRLQQKPTSVLWGGYVEGDPNSRVVFIVNKSPLTLFGEIRTGGTIYEVTPVSGQPEIVTIYAIEPSQFPREHGPKVPDQSLRPDSSDAIAMAHRLSDEPTPSKSETSQPGLATPAVVSAQTALAQAIPVSIPVIDVMVLYTMQAKDWRIGSHVCLAMDDLEQSFANSGIQATANLVHHGAINFDETNNSRGDDAWYTFKTRMDVQSERNKYAADVVVLWMSDLQGDECGGTRWINPPNAPIESYGFAVVVRNCATHYFSFPHEVGHVLGANHDRFEAEAGSSAYKNYGYVRADTSSIGIGWATLMAYTDRPDCPTKTFKDEFGNLKTAKYCERLLNWSDPLQKRPAFTGEPMGSTASPAGCTSKYATPPIVCDGPANNTEVLNSFVGTVSSFRVRNSTTSIGNTDCGMAGIISDSTPPLAPVNLRMQ